MPKAKWQQFSIDEIKEFAKHSTSNASFVEKMGYSRTGGSVSTTVKNILEAIPDLDISHFTGQGWNKNNYDYSRFQKGQQLKNGSAIKPLINLRGSKCERCGNNKWLGHDIPLEVHHKDGDHYNNEIDNLMLLCPNCHALTSNWRGKNKNNKETISDEKFAEALHANSSIRQALISLGLTAAGANYERAYRIIDDYNIEHLKNKS